MISVGPVEVVWDGLNLAILVLTAMAFITAVRTRRRVLQLGNRAAKIVATGSVRREGFRFLSQIGLAAIGLFEAFRDRDIQLTPPIAILLTVPIFIFANTYSDRRDRIALEHLTDDDIAYDRDKELEELKAMILENTHLTRHAASRAEAAYNEANHVNEKIAVQNQAILDQRRSLDQDTNEKVTDIHDRVIDHPE